MEDTSVAVTIVMNKTTETLDVKQEELLRLTANAAGIPIEAIDEKITVVRASIPTAGENQVPDVDVGTRDIVKIVTQLPWQVLAAIGAAIVLLLLLIILMMLRRRKKKKAQLILGEGEVLEGEDANALPGGEGESAEDGQPHAMPTSEEIEDEFAKNEEILNLRMQRSLRLKQNISEFVDQNPQIAAKLIQSWLRGEEDLGDARNRKQSK